MKIKCLPILLILLHQLAFSCCEGQISQRNEELYSHQLQRKVKLTIINTPMPNDNSRVNLLLLNDGQDIDRFRLKEIVDSLYQKKMIQALVVVAIHAGDRLKEYGVANQPDYQNRGDKAGNYDAFIVNELYPFVRETTGVRKFNSTAIAGCSLGGLSALDIGWNHPDLIDKVGSFSGSFWWRDKDDKAPDYSDENNRIMLAKIRSSIKKPHLKYWFYIGAKEEEGDRDKDGIIDAVDDTRDLVAIIKSKNICAPKEIVYTEDPNGKHDWPYWSVQLPAFLLWAFGKK